MSETPKVIDLGSKEIDPEEEKAYRERVQKAISGRSVASLKGNEPVGAVRKPQMPLLQKQKKDEVSAPVEGVQPRPQGSPILRPETEKQLEEAIKAGKQQEESKADEEKSKTQIKDEELFEAFDFGDMNRQVDRILDNKKRRAEIENRCEPMSFEDLLLKDEVKQRVPIIPGKFEPQFRSITPMESLFIKRRMAKETVTTDQYLGEKYNLLLLTCCLTDINGVALPDHRDIHGEPDDRLFDDKLSAIMKKSGYIIADLSVNYIWFDIRVRKLLNPDDLKNG